MSIDVPHQITVLLADWSKGDPQALEQLMPLVYDELRRMARGHLRRQAANHTFQTTELINEAYLKLAKNNGHKWENRSHFFGVAAKAMRHILVDHARSKQSGKRGGTPDVVTLSDNLAITNEPSQQLIALDEALKALEALDERKSRVIELKFFAGLTNEETAEVLNVSTETVKRDWQFARNWLLREIQPPI